MKIINLDCFLLLPDGVLFSKYTPNMFEELSIKRDSLLESRDFFYSVLVDSKKVPERINTTFHVDITSGGRDGCFDDNQLFAVWKNMTLNNFRLN